MAVEKVTTPVTQVNLINKVNEIITSVDSVISDTSENPVQNKVIYEALTAKADTTAIPTKTSDLTNDSGFLQTVKVNGTAQSVTDTTVNITFPEAATIGDAYLTIKRNGTAVGSFSANSTVPVSVDITVPTQASDIGALPDSTVIGSANVTIQRNGTAVGIINANQTVNAAIDITVPTVVSSLTNDAGYITGITGEDVTTALGYTPFNSANIDTVMSSSSINPVENRVIYAQLTLKADKTEIGSGNTTIKRNGTVLGTIGANQTANAAINITVPTVVSDLTNDAGYISGITSSDVTTALGYTPYNNTNPNGYQANVLETVKVNGTALTPSSKTVDITVPAIPTIGNANLTIQKNGSGVATFSANSTVAVTANISVPTTITELANSTQMAAINSGVTSTVVAQVGTNSTNITNIQTVIPSAASSSNQLADKSFVNSSIATNTANFIGTFASVAELEAYSGTLTNNDYAFVTTTDTAGNTIYNRYKYNSSETEWIFEYALNNSSFTADQWGAINSGITSVLAGQITTNQNEISTIKSIMSGYGNIVTHGASEFATAAQGSLADSALQPGNSNTLLTNDAGFITSISSSDVTTALGYTPYNDSNPSGFQANILETVKVNGTALTPSSKTVDITVPAAGAGNTTIKRNGTVIGTINANQTANNAIDISVPTSASDVGALPDSTVIGNANLVIQRNGVAVGTFNANSTVATNVNISVPTTAADVSALPSSTVIGNADLTIKRNGTAVGTFNANSTVAASVDISVPVVDSTISSTSVNPVQNKVVYEALTAKADKTEIPTVGTANLIIQQNGSAIGTFGANATSPVTVNIANTTYFAGSGLSLNGATINHSNTIAAGTIGSTAATTGASIAIPYATYDGQGHVTGKGTHTHSLSIVATYTSATETLTLALG